jgi:uncharacterized protein involved in outer membrane biogenesis
MVAASLERVGAALRRRWWILAILASLFVLYTAGGFLLVPHLARGAVYDYVEKTLKRRVAIGDMSFNPFTFVAEVHDFALTEADGSAIAAFDFLHVDFQLSSLFNGAWTFREIRIDKPNVSVLVSADGSLNLAKLAPPSPEPQPKPAAPASVPAIRIATLAVHDGRVGLEDGSRGRPFATTLTPIEFTLNDFRTAPNFKNEYRFEAATTAGERLEWSGQFSVQPLGSTGKFAVGALKAATIASYLQDALPFLLASGSLDLEGQYRATLADTMGLAVDLPTLKVHDVAIAPREGGDQTPWITLPETTLSGISFAIPEQKIAVERVDIDNPKLTVWREPDGQPNLLKLLPRSSAAPASAPAASAPFTISVGTIAVKNASIAAEDRMMRPAAKVTLAPVALTVTGYSSQPGNALKVDASVTVNGKGRVAAQGDLLMSPLTTTMNIDVADFDLTPLQPYIASVSGVQLLSGQVSAKTKIALNPVPAKGQSATQITGEVTVANFATRDTALRQDFIKWQRLQFTGINFRQGPDSLSIDRILARRPYSRVVISAEQTLNIAEALKSPGAGNAPASAAPPAAPAKAAAAMPIRIRQIAIEDGSMDFADFSIQPNFQAAIGGLAGTVTGLSSDPKSRATIKLAGSVDRYAPVDITGTVNLLSAAVYTDIAMNFRNMELTTFNPYSGKYAGYNISKGKLTTELKYKVENRKLDAQHHIVLDQLEFGQATNSKDAVPLPVRLAVALLKDRNGVIDLNLPVTGSLDDPQFRIGPIIWQAFINLLTKIVEAPFALIGSLFGGGEELAYVDFAPGSAMLTPAEQEKIGKLAKGLSERPELKLDIPLKTLSMADDAPLSEAAFNEALAAILPQGAPPAAQQRMAALAQLYERQLGMKPAYPAPPMPLPPGFDPVPGNIAFLEEVLRPKFAASEASRERLARARAEAVRDAVLNQEGVAPERVFLSERESGKGEAAATRMELDLQ